MRFSHIIVVTLHLHLISSYLVRSVYLAIQLFLSGALLSHFTGPIYLNSIILGSLYHRDHMSRAMFARMTSLDTLPTGYRFNRPLLSGITSPESRQPGKAPNFSTNWMSCDDSLEIVMAMQGKTETNTPSRLCKNEMFKLFAQAWSGNLPTLVPHDCNAPLDVYGDMKVLMKDYQAAKNHANKAFEKAGLGTWIKKPMEQDLFELS